MKTVIHQRPNRRKLRTDAALARLRAITESQRKCLGCGKAFKSAHAGVRMCPPCRARVSRGNEVPLA